MPKFKDVDPLEQPHATSGLRVSAGVIEKSIYDTTSYDELMQDYTNMRNSDCITGKLSELIKLPIMQAGYTIQSSNQEIVDYSYWALEQLRNGFDYFKRHCLLCLDYGHIFFEKVQEQGIDYNGNTTNIIRKMIPIQFETIHQFYYNESVEFDGIEHQRIDNNGASSYIDIVKDRLFFLSYDMEFEDVRGRSMYRIARQVYKFKQAVLESSTRAIHRGSGIPVFTKTETGDYDTETFNNLKTVGQTIGNTKCAYVILPYGVNLDLKALNHTDTATAQLQYLDTQLFYSTLTQFMASGIGVGANGSRSATSEHKSSYEMQANSILKFLEINIQALLNEMISISYLANVPKEELPVFKFDSVSQIDLNNVATNINTLISSQAITKTPEDEAFIRSLFGLPEIKKQEEVAQTPGQEVQAELEIKEAACKKKKTRELTEFEKNIFEFESAVNTFEEFSTKSEELINQIMEKLALDVVEQIRSGKKEVSLKYKAELSSKLQALYDKALANGQTDAQKEIGKISKTQLTMRKPKRWIELAEDNEFVKASIDRAVNKLFADIKNAVDSGIDSNKKMDRFTIEGIIEFVNGIVIDGLKQDKRTLITEVTSGYTDGRGTIFQEADVKEFIYTAKLDKKLCEKCSPFDGTIFTKEEIEKDLNLNFDKPINKDCLGKDFCRCQWIAIR